jgi:imidazolonepropionase-like amidohydrolase
MKQASAVSIVLVLAIMLWVRASAAADPAEPWTIVHAGHLLDRPGRAPRSNATVLIHGDRVESISEGFRDTGGFPQVPADTPVIDLRDRYVLPGLIDCHVHLTTDKAGVERQLARVSQSTASAAYEAAVNARKTLDAGFTTVRNLGDTEGVTLALRDAIAAGQLPGPRIIDAGMSISTTAGHMDRTLGYREELHEAVAKMGNVCDGADDCRRVVRQQIARGIDVIKIATTGGVNSPIGLGLGRQMFDDEARAIVATAQMYGKKVAVHAHGADGIVLALESGADSIEHGTLLDDGGIDLFVKTGAYYVPTLSTINGYIERLERDPDAYTPEVRAKIEWRIGITGKSLERAVPRGVKIAFGTDAGVSMHGRNAQEFTLMVKHGMSAQQAIVAATVNAADLLGLSDRVGSLEPGKQADLIAVGGDPLADVTVLESVQFVMQDGRVHKSL